MQNFIYGEISAKVVKNISALALKLVSTTMKGHCICYNNKVKAERNYISA